jgi:hypothetical protein
MELTNYSVVLRCFLPIKGHMLLFNGIESEPLKE